MADGSILLPFPDCSSSRGRDAISRIMMRLPAPTDEIPEALRGPLSLWWERAADMPALAAAYEILPAAFARNCPAWSPAASSSARR